MTYQPIPESPKRKIPVWVWIVAPVALVFIVCCSGMMGAVLVSTKSPAAPIPTTTTVTPTAPVSQQEVDPAIETSTPTSEPTVEAVDLCAPYLTAAGDYAASDQMSGQPTIEKMGTPETPLYAINATWIRPGLTAQFDCRVWQGNLQYAQYSTQDRRVDLITGNTI